MANRTGYLKVPDFGIVTGSPYEGTRTKTDLGPYVPGSITHLVERTFDRYVDVPLYEIISPSPNVIEQGNFGAEADGISFSFVIKGGYLSGEAPFNSPPFDLTQTFLVEIRQNTDPASNVIFRQLLTITTSVNTGASTTVDVSTTVIDGQTILPADAVNWLDNGNIAEVVSFTTPSLPGAALSFSMSIEMASYRFSVPSDATVRVTRTGVETNSQYPLSSLGDGITEYWIKRAVRSSVLCLSDGTFFSATEDGAVLGNVEIRRVLSETVVGDLIYTFVQFKNPCLWSNDAGQLFCALENPQIDFIGDFPYSVSSRFLYRSYDWGKTWEFLTVTPYWNDNYFRATECEIPGNGAGSVAIQGGGGSTRTIKFQASADGVTWPGQALAVTVDTYSGNYLDFQVLSKIVGGQFDLKITNSRDAAWTSNDKGRTWVAL